MSCRMYSNQRIQLEKNPIAMIPITDVRSESVEKIYGTYFSWIHFPARLCATGLLCCHNICCKIHLKTLSPEKQCSCFSCFLLVNVDLSNRFFFPLTCPTLRNEPLCSTSLWLHSFRGVFSKICIMSGL